MSSRPRGLARVEFTLTASVLPGDEPLAKIDPSAGCGGETQRDA